MSRSVLERLSRQAAELDEHNCVHCSYIGKRKYKLCDECLARWLEANGYSADGNKKGG